MGMERGSRRAAAVATLGAHDAWRPLALAAVALVSIAGYLALHPLAPAGLAGHPRPAALLVVAPGVPPPPPRSPALAPPRPPSPSHRAAGRARLRCARRPVPLRGLPAPPPLY